MNKDLLKAIEKSNSMIASRAYRMSNIWTTVWIGCIAIISLPIYADKPIEELEMRAWTTVDFYDAIERNDAQSVLKYMTDTKRATKEFLSYYLLDYALEIERDYIASMMVEAGAGMNTLLAVQHENVRILEKMLQHDVEPRGASIAAERGNLQILKLLLSHGADDLNTEGAARNGHLDAVKLLLNHGAEPNGLGVAVLHGRDEVVEILLDKGADPNELTRYEIRYFESYDDISGPCVFEYLSPLHYAVLNKSLDLVKALLKAGADPNIVPSAVTLQKNRFDIDPWPTVLQTAQDPKWGDKDIAQFLEEHGAKVSVSNTDKIANLDLVLYLAANDWDYDEVSMYLERGAKPVGFGRFFYEYSESYDPKVTQAFIEAGADPNFFDERTGWMYTPTALTLMNRDIDNFKRYIQAGSNTQEHLLSWYMKIANVRGLNEAIEMLWNLGVDLKFAQILSPISYGNIHTLEFLLDRGIRPDFLRHAVEKERVKFVRILLEAGADPNQPDDYDERSILEIAVELENEEIANLLKAAGAIE